MKYKKVIATLLAVGCIGLVGGLGYFLGQANQEKKRRKTDGCPSQRNRNQATGIKKNCGS